MKVNKDCYKKEWLVLLSVVELLNKMRKEKSLLYLEILGFLISIVVGQGWSRGLKSEEGREEIEYNRFFKKFGYEKEEKSVCEGRNGVRRFGVRGGFFLRWKKFFYV